MCDGILLGGINYDLTGRALGPYRLRTAAEKAGYDIKVIDYSWALDANQIILLFDKVISDKTLVLGISASWFDKYRDSSCNKWATDKVFDHIRCKYPNIKIVVGGTKLNAHPILVKHADWFVIGFADIAFVKILNFLKGTDCNVNYETINNTKVIYADKYYPIKDMDSIETVFKCEDKFLRDQPMPIEIARGCIFKCAFCSHPFLGKKSYDYVRSSHSIAAELKRNFELFGTYRYTISDDTFNDSLTKIDIVEKAVEQAQLPKFEFVGYIRPELLVTHPTMISRLANLGLKGAHLGIESMHNPTRKIIGKGMNIERVLEAVAQLRNFNVKVHATFIVGLPEDDLVTLHKGLEFIIFNKNKYFHSWLYNGLGLSKGLRNESYSLFEKHPELYGYTTGEKKHDTALEWKHTSGMTREAAGKIAAKLNAISYKHCQIAGWSLASAWFHSLSSEAIEEGTYESTEFLKHARLNSLKRAEQNYKSLLDR